MFATSVGHLFYDFGILESLVFFAGAGFGSIHNYRIFVRLLAAEGYFGLRKQENVKNIEPKLEQHCNYENGAINNNHIIVDDKSE